MYKQCKLVHADLSEYNILWHNDKVWFIDVSQSVEPFHPHALEFLYRDCTNVVQFFTKCGVSGVVSAQELFNKVTELGITPGTDRDFLSQVTSCHQINKSMSVFYGFVLLFNFIFILFKFCRNIVNVAVEITKFCLQTSLKSFIPSCKLLFLRSRLR